jgi:hypothetical protein
MTEQQAMQILADMGLHEGGMDNWVPDNAWYRFANVVEAAARADERERIEKAWDKLYGWWESDDETKTRGTT